MTRFIEAHQVRVVHFLEEVINTHEGTTTNRALNNIMKQSKKIMRSFNETGQRTSAPRLTGYELVSRRLQIIAWSAQVRGV